MKWYCAYLINDYLFLKTKHPLDIKTNPEAYAKYLDKNDKTLVNNIYLSLYCQ